MKGKWKICLHNGILLQANGNISGIKKKTGLNLRGIVLKKKLQELKDKYP